MKNNILLALLLTVAGAASAQPLCIPGVQTVKNTKGSIQAEDLKAVVCDNPELQDVARYLERTYVPQTATAANADGQGLGITLKLKADKKLGEEGYRLTTSPKGVTIEAGTARGALWGAQTLLQMRQTSPALPCGTITDQPDYPIRGLMIDCGRKFVPMSYLRSLVEVMSYYKMNTLQLHLNDNGFKNQFHDNWDETYAAFRMESTVFPGLTAIDGHYTKQEMRDLVRYAEKMGVEIIPEFDAPAHALAFTHYRPSLSSEEFGADHLDLRNPEVLPFLDSLYAEYLGGPDPVFTCPRFHIGTDEYSNRDSVIVERFRDMIVHLCQTVKSYGRQPVLWGSLTHAKGVTPVPSDGVMMSMWYNGYADPRAMHEAGFHMITIPDGYVYIVPEAGYYYNYLNQKYLYQHWSPAQIGDQRFEHKDPLIEGGMFAVWNDIHGNGIAVGDIHHRMLPAIQVVAEKTWHALADSTDAAFAQWEALSKRLDDGPLTDEIGRRGDLELAELKADACMDGQGGLRQVGFPYTVEFTIDWAGEKPGTVLTTSERSTFYLSDPIRGMLGFSRDGYLFTFKYRGEKGRRETLRLEGDNQGLSLYADGHLVERLNPDVQYKTDGKGTYRIMRTLVFPLQQAGNFRSHITNFSAKHRK